MNRRTIVSALGANIVSLTGCLGEASSGSDSTTTDTPTPTHADSRREVGVTSIGTVPSGTPLSHSVKVLRSGVNADQTARIAVEVTNTADQTVWNESRITAFGDFIIQKDADGQRLLLLHPDVEYPTVSSECWRTEISEFRINHAYTNVVAKRRYEPGGTRTTKFDIYGHPENTGPCLPLGEYPSESLYVVRDDFYTHTAEWEYKWGFSLNVTES